jgi:hypothetical protein
MKKLKRLKKLPTGYEFMNGTDRHREGEAE